jgi:hypothetical protein
MCLKELPQINQEISIRKIYLYQNNIFIKIKVMNMDEGLWVLIVVCVVAVVGLIVNMSTNAGQAIKPISSTGLSVNPASKCLGVSSSCTSNTDCCSGYCLSSGDSGSCVARSTMSFSPASCDDTDNGDYFTAGVASGLFYLDADSHSTEFVQKSDECADALLLFEYSCQNIDGEDIVVSQAYPCPNGCSNGACNKGGVGSVGAQ